MTRLTRSLIALLFASSALLVGAFPVAAKAPGPGDAGYAVIAGTALTCTDSNVDGPVGLDFTTAPTQTGCTLDVHYAPGAYDAFQRDYAWIAGHLLPCEVLTGTLDGVPLPPGVYCFDAAAALTGTLTLTGAGPWTFEIGAGAVGALTITNFTVLSDNPCNAIWWIDADVTMTDSNFVGTILGGKGITLTRTILEGRAWATGAMTMTNSTISGCLGSGTKTRVHCNQGVGNGPEGCDPGNSNQGDEARSNDELGGTPGDPGRQGGNKD